MTFYKVFFFSEISNDSIYCVYGKSQRYHNTLCLTKNTISFLHYSSDKVFRGTFENETWHSLRRFLNVILFANL